MNRGWTNRSDRACTTDSNTSDETPTAAVTAEAVGETYRSFADDVTAVEATTAVPVDGLADVGAALRTAADAMATGERTARTVAVVDVYRRLTERAVPESVVAGLSGLDAVVNAADDVIDVRPMSAAQRFEFCSNLLFGHVLLVDELGTSNALTEILLEYYTALAQIPLVERRLQQQLERTTDRSAELELARQMYEFDSVDIEAFATIPALELELDPAIGTTVLENLRTFRARHLLFEDIRHVTRTSDQGDTNPVQYFLRTCESSVDAARCIRDIAASLRYPHEDPDYVDVLRRLERRPASLEDVIAREQTRLDGSS